MNQAGNYRSISVACMMISEKLVYSQMIYFIIDGSILYMNQSGFRNCFSTCFSSAAFAVKEHIVTCFEDNEIASAVIIDLSYVFDTVDHILLKKNFCYGVQDNSFDWCKSYLAQNQQRSPNKWNTI